MGGLSPTAVWSVEGKPVTKKSMRERFHFHLVKDPVERSALMVMLYKSTEGHGDIGPCGVAHVSLSEVAELLSMPLGETLRMLKSVAEAIRTICVCEDDQVLFAMPDALQGGFDHLYKREGFEGLPPRLPKGSKRQ